MPLKASSSFSRSDWEDDAWGSASDDDQFVLTHAPASATGASTSRKKESRSKSRSVSAGASVSASASASANTSASASASASGRGVASCASGASTSNTTSQPKSIPSSRTHAPPARPHPYPVHSSADSSGESPGAGSMTSVGPGSIGSRASWTIVDTEGLGAARDPSPAAAPGRTVSNASVAPEPIVGSPPTDVGASAAAAMSGQANTATGSSAARVPGQASNGAAHGEAGALENELDIELVQKVIASSARGEADGEEEPQSPGSARRRRRRVPGTSEADAMKAAIRKDLDSLVDDPVSALRSLTTCSDSVSPSGLASASMPLTPGTAIPPSALSGAPFSPFTSLSSTSLSSQPQPFSHRAGDMSPGLEAAYDPIAMGGDGLIATSSPFPAPDMPTTARAETSPYTQVGEVDAVDSGAVTPGIGAGAGVARSRSVRSVRRRQRFIRCLERDSVDLAELRKLAWGGVPNELRPMVWQLLLGYLPAASSVRAPTLARKRAEYASGVRLAFAKGTAGLDQAIWHQIHIDVPRTNPGIRLWQREGTQRSLERILYVWAIRHPASGYVQGINDLVTPFVEVFLSAYIESDPELYDVALLPPHALEALEADSFWCLSKLLDGIQDNYIFAQPGIQRQVRRMSELVARIDAPLHGHLQEQGVEYMQFAFRWMNCLLMREMSVKNIIRMWDTYLAEGPEAFSQFHLYVCAAFLVKWSKQLLAHDFQGVIIFLQSPPTQDWSDREAELLLSEAFMWQSLFASGKHLNK